MSPDKAAPAAMNGPVSSKVTPVVVPGMKGLASACADVVMDDGSDDDYVPDANEAPVTAPSRKQPIRSKRPHTDVPNHFFLFPATACARNQSSGQKSKSATPCPSSRTGQRPFGCVQRF